uniref:Uncharacterized protein n=1 Tax=Micrurus corallinus TaxID=54390 RepID=A0A2D4FA48_MICCO
MAWHFLIEFPSNDFKCASLGNRLRNWGGKQYYISTFCFYGPFSIGTTDSSGMILRQWRATMAYRVLVKKIQARGYKWNIAVVVWIILILPFFFFHVRLLLESV